MGRLGCDESACACVWTFLLFIYQYVQMRSWLKSPQELSYKTTTVRPQRNTVTPAVRPIVPAVQRRARERGASHKKPHNEEARYGLPPRPPAPAPAHWSFLLVVGFSPPPLHLPPSPPTARQGSWGGRGRGKEEGLRLSLVPLSHQSQKKKMREHEQRGASRPARGKA